MSLDISGRPNSSYCFIAVSLSDCKLLMFIEN